MLLPRFQYHEPTSLAEACRMMAELGMGVRPIAGGTDLVVNMRRRTLAPEHVVSLGRIKELCAMDLSDRVFTIGACCTVASLAESSAIASRFHALNEGALSLGSPLVRNLATAGGNLVTARPAADLPPPLMAYGASVTLRSSQEQRVVPLDQFFVGPGRTIMKPTEILTSIVFETSPPFSGSSYIKLGTRRALEISIVSVASFLALERPGGRIQSARIFLGSVAPVPMRARDAETTLIGEIPGQPLFVKAGETAAGESKPIDDHRGTAGYRRDMVAVLTQKTLQASFERAIASG
ncbi:MAG TPA: xanthine dehydrogenase family protein subunit M [Desulfatiglandales bacterium]|nr:xanthine dehydrogenase family protein subunit M [Desulfatiglandales bacterium]